MKRKVYSRNPVTGEWAEKLVDDGRGRARPRRGGKMDRGSLATRSDEEANSRYPRGERVYFIQASGGLIKIGCTRDLRKRWANLRTLIPVDLTLLGSIPGYRDIEHALHVRFEASRVHGEWFKPSPEILSLARGETVLSAAGILPARAT